MAAVKMKCTVSKCGKVFEGPRSPQALGGHLWQSHHIRANGTPKKKKKIGKYKKRGNRVTRLTATHKKPSLEREREERDIAVIQHFSLWQKEIQESTDFQLKRLKEPLKTHIERLTKEIERRNCETMDLHELVKKLRSLTEPNSPGVEEQTKKEL